jgi:hypothetical protein
MNEKLNLYDVEVGQSSKGFWYCKSLKITHYNDQVLGIELDELMGTVEEKIDQHNEGKTE